MAKKTQWHVDSNGGTVPLLEMKDGKMMSESSDIIKWTDNQAEGQGQLFPDDQGLTHELEKVAAKGSSLKSHFMDWIQSRGHTLYN